MDLTQKEHDMKKILSGIALALGLTVGLHALPTYDASGYADNTPSFSFNNTGSTGTYLVVGVIESGSSQPGILSVSYGGTDMNQGTSTYSLTSTMYEFYLATPATGANNVVVTFISTPTDYHVTVGAWDGVSGIGNMASVAPPVSTSMTYGSQGGGSLAVYFGASTGVSPTITNTAMTGYIGQARPLAAYAFGSTTITTALTFTGTATGAYQLIGTMLELQAAGTPTDTPTYTNTTVPTATPTDTPTFTSSATPTNTLVSTATLTSTLTVTPSATPTVTNTTISTNTASPTDTPTSTMTQTFTASPTASPTVTKSDTPTTGSTPTFTNSPTVTPSAPPTNTPSPSASPTNVPLAYQSLAQPVVPAAPFASW